MKNQNRYFILGFVLVFSIGLIVGLAFKSNDPLENMLSSDDPNQRRQAISLLSRLPDNEGATALLRNDPLADEKDERVRNDLIMFFRHHSNAEVDAYLEQQADHEDPFVRFKSLEILVHRNKITAEDFVGRLEEFHDNQSIASLTRINVLTDVLTQGKSSAWAKSFCRKIFTDQVKTLLRHCLEYTLLDEFNPKTNVGKELFQKSSPDFLVSVLNATYRHCPAHRLDVLTAYLERAKGQTLMENALARLLPRMPEEDRKLINKNIKLKSIKQQRSQKLDRMLCEAKPKEFRFDKRRFPSPVKKSR